MSTTTESSARASASSGLSASSLASSAAFGTFAVVFAITMPVLYVICDLVNLPAFTYHPATGRVDLGWGAPRSGEGPVMYWYGWTVTSLAGASILGIAAAMLPQHVTRRIPLALVWIVPILAVPVLVYSLRPFWFHP
jgi:hypothetical protein